MTKTKPKTEKDKSHNAMICPRCNAIGKKSLLFCANEFREKESAEFNCFYDTDGEFHAHFVETPEWFRCSNAHLSMKLYDKYKTIPHNCNICRDNKNTDFTLDTDGAEWFMEQQLDFTLEFVRDMTNADDALVFGKVKPLSKKYNIPFGKIVAGFAALVLVDNVLSPTNRS